MIAAVMAVHLSMLAAGFALARFVGLSREDQIAVGFAGSQKTLMVGLKISLDLQYSILPIVVYHVGQLLVDTLIADRLKSMPRQDRTGQLARPEPGPEDSDVDAGRSRS
jgi:sodium/bile acid cotransporter 7